MSTTSSISSPSGLLNSSTNNNNGSAASSSITSSNGNNNNNPNNPDRLSNVSILGQKYLLFEETATTNSTNMRNYSSCVLKYYQRCVKVETREAFSCRVVARTREGLQLIASYHRLEAGCDAISQVHEVISDPTSFNLIMPPTFGSVHAYLLAKKKLGEAEAANIFKQIVTAVQYCHSKGIVLRDIKMGKFAFHDKERTIVKLDNLEDSVLLNDLSDDKLADNHGCPNYVSPEKAEILRSKQKYPGKANDMWGLGVVLYTLLVGRYPFNDQDHSKLFAKIRRGHYIIPDWLSGPAKCLIGSLLQKNPAARPSCGEILNHSWINSRGPGSKISTAGPCRVGSGGSSSSSQPAPLIIPQSNFRVISTPVPVNVTFSPTTTTTTNPGEYFFGSNNLSSSSHSSAEMDSSAATSESSSAYINMDCLNEKADYPEEPANDDQVVPCID